jgi:hypothetical protein
MIGKSDTKPCTPALKLHDFVSLSVIMARCRRWRSREHKPLSERKLPA